MTTDKLEAAKLLHQETLAGRIIAFVEAHPGCTARQVRDALGVSAGTRVATLAVAGRLRRYSDGGGPWQYYRARPAGGSP